MNIQTDSVTTVDSPQATLPDQRRPQVMPDATPDQGLSLRPARPRPSRRRLLVAGAAVLCLTLGVAAWAIASQGSDQGPKQTAPGQVDDRGQVVHGTKGHLVDGNGALIVVGPRSTPGAPGLGDRPDDVVHGTRGNLYTVPGVRLHTPPQSWAVPEHAEPPTLDSSLAGKLAGIGLS